MNLQKVVWNILGGKNQPILANQTSTGLQNSIGFLTKLMFKQFANDTSGKKPPISEKESPPFSIIITIFSIRGIPLETLYHLPAGREGSSPNDAVHHRGGMFPVETRARLYPFELWTTRCRHFSMYFVARLKISIAILLVFLSFFFIGG